jgi:RNA polymerase sigma factor for flagellar operon FliA
VTTYEGAEPVDHAASPADLASLRQSKGRVSAALHGLPERLQTLLALYYQEELSYHEISRVLGISRSRICQLHTQALDKLKKALAAHGD